MLQPKAYGYVRANLYANVDPITAARQELASFADREGFALTDIFVEDEGRHTSAFAELIEAIKANNVRYVITPSLRHLARLPGLRNAIRVQLKGEGVNLRDGQRYGLPASIAGKEVMERGSKNATTNQSRSGIYRRQR